MQPPREALQLLESDSSKIRELKTLATTFYDLHSHCAAQALRCNSNLLFMFHASVSAAIVSAVEVSDVGPDAAQTQSDAADSGAESPPEPFEPCCAMLAQAMNDGEEQTIELTGGEHPILMLAVSDTESVRQHWPMFYCPFCGTELQTQSHVDEWFQRPDVSREESA